ncbi:Phosphoserine phosphatase [Helicobacter bizzozeronii CCUG 35545]|nr:Phosphoserine phosphatase [Helicobacter bizzozeronii CCUG 35545]
MSGPMMRSDSKAEMLASLQELLQVKHTLAIGDGANDISMFKLADLSVAFNAKEITKKSRQRGGTNPRLAGDFGLCLTPKITYGFCCVYDHKPLFCNNLFDSISLESQTPPYL